MKKSLKYLSVLIAFFMAADLAVSTVFGADRINWYFKPTSDHTQPELLGGSKLLNHKALLSIGSPDEKKVYLTFDAGYANESTDKILDVLREEQVNAAFFILPAIFKYTPLIAQKMIDGGHTVCNHTTTHKNMSTVSDFSVFEAELSKIAEEYKQSTGKEMAHFFRPPEGSFTEQTLDFSLKAGYKTVFWSFAYADWDNSKQKSPEWAKQKILDNIHNGEVLLLHSNSATNAAVLKDVIIELKKQGYAFGTLDELERYKDSLCNTAMSKTEVLEKYKNEGTVFSDNSNAGKCVALTFDDGPHPAYTPEILDILKQYNIKATFFVIGKNVEENPALVCRAIDEGHEIGNHTYSHPDIRRLDSATLESEILKTDTVLKEFANYKCSVFRPPHGDYSESDIETVKSKGLKYILWSWRIDTLDWKCASVQNISKAVLNNVRGGDIVLLHDYVYGKSNTPEALKIIIPKLIEDGYKFVTVSELISSKV